MNKIRDIIYNISDILVTLLIIIIALLLISWRVSAIMHYGTPDDSASTSSTTQSEQDAGSTTQSEQDAGSADAENIDNSSDSVDADVNAPTGDVSFTVSANQTADSIGQALADAGLVADKQTFINAVNAAGAATRLKMGTFTIPAGSTPEQIVVILTS